MTNNEYFIEALQSGAYKRLDWVIDCFTQAAHKVIMTSDEETRTYKDFYPYELVRMEGDEGLYFADHQDETFKQLTEYKPNEALFRFDDVIDLKPNDLPNVKEDIRECYGNVMINAVLFCHPFGDKIPFMKGRISPDDIKKEVVPRLMGRAQDGNNITVEEFIKHCDAASSLEGWVLMCAPSATVETLLPTPGVLELRDKLLKEHEHELDNPAVVASIMMQLAKYEKEVLSKTEADGFYLSGKSYDVVRMKRFIMYGMEGGFGGTKPELIKSSLNEGWDMDAFPAMVDGLRAGSYARGKETAKGGELYNTIQRIFQNVKIDADDCGSKHGMSWTVTKDNHKQFIGLYQIKSGKPVRIEHDQTEALIGTTITVRTPMLCKHQAPNYCKTCCGDTVSAGENTLHTTIGRVGSVFMYARMKSMHGKASKTTRVNLETDFS